MERYGSEVRIARATTAEPSRYVILKILLRLLTLENASRGGTGASGMSGTGGTTGITSASSTTNATNTIVTPAGSLQYIRYRLQTMAQALMGRNNTRDPILTFQAPRVVYNDGGEEVEKVIIGTSLLLKHFIACKKLLD